MFRRWSAEGFIIIAAVERPMPETYERVTVEASADRSIRSIRLDNGTGNVIDSAVTEDLGAAIDAAADETAVDAIVLGGTGGTFCSGADLEEIAGLDRAGGVRWLEDYHAVVDRLRTTGKPTIAAVDGDCVAGGQELAIACDLIVAAESARFGQPEVLVGSTAAAGGVQLLPLMIGERRARELLLTGRLLEAEEAESIGLINRLVPDEDLEDEAVGLALEVVENASPQAYRTIKSMLKRWHGLGMAGWEAERELTAATWDSAEFRERAAAFLAGEELERRSFGGAAPRDG